eukprot:NODE_62_length_26495_cov_0.832853.p16 type:complete len:194 gc:universal NODE_62_length_26495_cov_0.832853:7349-6768(-)
MVNFFISSLMLKRTRSMLLYYSFSQILFLGVGILLLLNPFYCRKYVFDDVMWIILLSIPVVGIVAVFTLNMMVIRMNRIYLIIAMILFDVANVVQIIIVDDRVQCLLETDFVNGPIYKGYPEGTGTNRLQHDLLMRNIMIPIVLSASLVFYLTKLKEIIFELDDVRRSQATIKIDSEKAISSPNTLKDTEQVE